MDTITVDFERGAYNALRTVFGQLINVNGCFFYLTQSTLRKATVLGQKQYIVEDSNQFDAEIRMFVAMIDALAFVPIADISIALNVLQNIGLTQGFCLFWTTLSVPILKEDQFQMPILLNDLPLCFHQ